MLTHGLQVTIFSCLQVPMKWLCWEKTWRICVQPTFAKNKLLLVSYVFIIILITQILETILDSHFCSLTLVWQLLPFHTDSNSSYATLKLFIIKPCQDLCSPPWHRTCPKCSVPGHCWHHHHAWQLVATTSLPQCLTDGHHIPACIKV